MRCDRQAKGAGRPPCPPRKSASLGEHAVGPSSPAYAVTTPAAETCARKVPGRL
jgi:hypothetical protein